MSFEIGIQVCPHAILDEGVDQALDLMVEKAGINSLMLNTHSYYGAANGWRKNHSLAQDHGAALSDPGDGSLERPWVVHQESTFAGLPVKHRPMDASIRYGNGDIFGKLVEAAHQRGMKVYARYLEGWESARLRHIPNWTAVLAEDLQGQKMQIPCFTNPVYREWWRATIEDVARLYPIDGYFLGFERAEPLSDTLFPGQKPYCFCEHCVRRGRENGVDIARARLGWEMLANITRRAMEGGPSRHDGLFPETLRVLLRYPEVIQWSRLEWEGQESLAAMSAGVVKRLRPNAEFGMISHPDGLDVFKVAREDWEAKGELCDFMVLRLYTDIAGPRTARNIQRARKRFLRDFSEKDLLSFNWRMIGLDPQNAPEVDYLKEHGYPLEYVEVNSRRCAQALGSKCRFLIGFGIDIPKEDGHPFPTDAGFLEKCVQTVLKEGARGVVLCREYEEIRASNMEVVGKIVKNLGQ